MDIPVLIDGRNVTALVDTGADYSIISGKLASLLKKVIMPWTGSHVGTAGGHVTPLGVCTARLQIRSSTFLVSSLVLRECSRELILGMDFLREYGAIIDLRRRCISFSTVKATSKDTCRRTAALRVSDDSVTIPPRASIMIQVSSEGTSDGETLAECNVSLLLALGISVARGIVDIRNGQAEVMITNFTNEHRHLFRGTAVAYAEALENVIECFTCEDSSRDGQAVTDVDINNALSEEHKKALRELLLEFRTCFAQSSKVSQTPITQHRIITYDDARPIHQQPYRVSQKERAAIKEQVKEMIDDGVIQPSNSPWSSPVVLVKKKDGTLRFCVDYRKLNNVTKKDVYPLPRIDDSLDRLRRAKYFSSLDLKSGYWQIEVDERDREKTAFVTPDGLYEFRVLPFGLCSAPATFQRMMDTVLADLKWQSCLVYLDDVVVFSASFSEHLKRLRQVLEAIRSANLTLKPQKCHFGYEELKFLGHLVSAEGVRPDPEKTTAVAAFPTPADKKSVRRFLGLCAYYRRFIGNFSKIAEPLTRLTRADTPFVWSSEQETAFTELRHRLASPPVLGHFDEEAETEIHTDASNIGLGAVLVQRQEGVERVIAYASRTLSRPESNYSTTEKECLAVVWALAKFRPYLYGRPFKIVTDHHSLCWLANLRDPSGRLARWSLRLQEYDVTIVYKSGHAHEDADTLSRAPVEPPAQHLEDDCPFLGAVSITDLATRQRADAGLRPIMEHLEGRNVSLPPNIARGLSSSFCLRQGVLYKKNAAASNKTYLLVVPAGLRDEILFACHDEPSSGHLGITRTLARVRKSYYWPKLAACVKQYVQACRECQRRKSPSVKPAGLLNPIQPPRTPFDQVGMDLLGPFPLSSSGNKWIIVATDYLTRYAETKALPKGTASEVAQFFTESVVLRHGAPSCVITDRGTAFTARLLEKVFQLSCTTHRKTTAYHPQTNGLTERLNKTMTDMLSMYIDVQHKTWDEVLPYVTFAYNTATQETTRFTPFRLLYGRDVQTMLDAMLPCDIDNIDNLDEDAECFVQRAEEARQLARVNIKKQQDVDTRRYNLRHRQVDYQPGDQVLVWTPVRRKGLSEKLLSRYFGPYKVLRRVSDVNYEVLPDGSQSPRRRQPRPEIVHVVRLKPYYTL